MEFNTYYTANIVCPHCGREHKDSWEVDFGPGIEGDTEMECGSCNSKFFVSRRAEISYTSLPIKK